MVISHLYQNWKGNHQTQQSATLNNSFYYTDTSVLLENIPLVKLIKTKSGTRVVYFP